jgi:hypothetical protein
MAFVPRWIDAFWPHAAVYQSNAPKVTACLCLVGAENALSLAETSLAVHAVFTPIDTLVRPAGQSDAVNTWSPTPASGFIREQALGSRFIFYFPELRRAGGLARRSARRSARSSA